MMPARWVLVAALLSGCVTPPGVGEVAGFGETPAENMESMVEMNKSIAAAVCVPTCYSVTSLGHTSDSFRVRGAEGTRQPVTVEFFWNATTEASRTLVGAVSSGGEVMAEWTGSSPIIALIDLDAGQRYGLHVRPDRPLYVAQEVHALVRGNVSAATG